MGERSRSDVDPLFIAGIPVIGAGVALLVPLGAFSMVLVAAGAALMLAGLLRMRSSTRHRR